MSNIITFEEVQNRIKNKTLEELSSQDIFDRYFVYGTEKEQNNPVIQKLMIEHGYTGPLLDTIDIITDKEVEMKVLKSRINESINLKLVKGYLKKIEATEVILDNDRKMSKHYQLHYEFEEYKTKSVLHFYEGSIDDIYWQKLEKEIKSLMNDLVVLLVEETDSILCIMKYYDEINYEFK